MKCKLARAPLRSAAPHGRCRWRRLSVTHYREAVRLVAVAIGCQASAGLAILRTATLDKSVATMWSDEAMRIVLNAAGGQCLAHVHVGESSVRNTIVIHIHDCNVTRDYDLHSPSWHPKKSREEAD